MKFFLTLSIFLSLHFVSHAQAAYYDRLGVVVRGENDKEIFRVFDSLNNHISTQEKHDIAHCLYAEFCQLQDNYEATYSNYWLKKAAEEGHPCAQANLGYLYEIGKGFEKSYSKAMQWYERANKNDTVDLSLYLGLKYFEGKIVPKDNKFGASLFLQDAKNGNFRSSIIYGLCKLYGVGIDKNEQEGLKWLNLRLSQRIR